MLKPLRDYVVLEKAKEEEKTKSGIILTEQPKEEPGKGIVVAVGPGKTESGTLVPVELKVGQKVVYKKYSGTEIKEGNKEYLLIEAENILAIDE
ncbi:MAG: co-chaperone GroES [Erysipelotrichaceae bacterium]|nr:co-chaperone GroES [Erysipelotrichaceae bacterium]MDY6034584.1 co-chaperone GroES [Bulleidia sp.]